MTPTYTKGQNVLITVNGIPVGCDKQTNIEITSATFDTTTKCSVDANGVLYAEAIPTIISTKFTGNGLVPMLSSAGQPTEQSLMQLATLQFSQAKVSVTWEAPVVGGQVRLFFSQDAWVTSVKAGATNGEVVTYDYELTGNGPILTHPIS